MTFKQTQHYKQYHNLLRRHRKAAIELALLMASRKNGIVTADEKEYQLYERTRLALDSFIVANLQLNKILGEQNASRKLPHSK